MPGEFMAAMGLRLSHVAGDRVEGSMELGPQHHQPWGIVHGGVYCAAVETAASAGAVAAVAGQGLTAVGVNNNTHFLRSMTGGAVSVAAVPLHQSRSFQLWEVRLTDGEGRLVALGQVRLQNVTPRGSVRPAADG